MGVWCGAGTFSRTAPHTHWEAGGQFLTNLSRCWSHDSATQLLGIGSRQIKTYVPTKTWSYGLMHSHQVWKQQCPPTGDWMNNRWSVAGRITAQMARDDLLIPADRWRNTQRRCAERKEPDRKGHGPYIYASGRVGDTASSGPQSADGWLPGAQGVPGRGRWNLPEPWQRSWARAGWIYRNSWNCTPGKGGFHCVYVTPQWSFYLKTKTNLDFPGV